MTHTYIQTLVNHYPDLSIESWERNKIGQNNDVFIANKNLVFRFPKYKEGIAQLKMESVILKAIKDQVPLQIPEPIYSSLNQKEPRSVFTGYPFIKGTSFWRETLNGIQDEAVVQRVAYQLVSFLKSLHSFSKKRCLLELGLNNSDPINEMEILYNKIKKKLYPFIRKEAQNSIAQSFKRFLEGEARSHFKTTLIHGDFGASNLLWDPESKQITGVIDFGGSGLGDPAYDFAGLLSSYGESFFNRCLSLYPNGAAIAERIRFYKSTFALQEALHGLENDDHEAFENGITAYR